MSVIYPFLARQATRLLILFSVVLCTAQAFSQSVNRVALSSSKVVGSNSVTGTVTLNGTAGSSGFSVALSSDSASATLPASVTVPAGLRTATFIVSTIPVDSITNVSVKADAATAPLEIDPPSVLSLKLAKATVLGGQSVGYTMKLSGPAGPSGIPFLMTVDRTCVQVADFVVPAGVTNFTQSISTTPVANSTSAAINAIGDGVNAAASLTITAPKLSTFTVAPTSVAGGGTVTGTVTLTGPAAVGGVSVTVGFDNSILSTSATLVIPAGSTSATFPIDTLYTSVLVKTTITASVGAKTIGKTVKVLPSPPTSPSNVTFVFASVIGGQMNQGTVTLSSPAPSTGITVSLSSSSNSASVSPVIVPAGQTSANFIVASSTVATSTPVTITATIGSATKSASVTLLPGWSMFHADSQGTSLGIASTAVGIIKWQSSSSLPLALDPLIGSDGTIYVSGGNTSTLGKLYALNPDGSVKWTYDTGVHTGPVPITLTMAPDGTIYVPFNGVMYAVNPDGTLKWKVVLVSGLSTALSSARLGPDGTLHALITGPAPKLLAVDPANGSVKWSVTPSSTFTMTALGVSKMGITVSTEDKKLSLYGFDGTLKRVFDTIAPLRTPPAVGSDGSMYFGDSAGYFYAIDPTGAQKWRYQVTPSMAITPAIGPDGSVYFSSGDQNVYSFTPDGTPNWLCSLPNNNFGSPTVGANGMIYVACLPNQTVYAISPSGIVQWFCTSAGTGTSAFGTCPVIAPDGTLVVGGFGTLTIIK